MFAPSTPENESARLEKLRSIAVLDTPPERSFEDLLELAVLLCDTPMGVITLIDRDRQWFKARRGIDARETPREISFCGHTITQSGIFEVPDATVDHRFVDNPQVTGEPHIRFYAGTPLITDDDLALGSLAVIDTEPRELTDEMRRGLRVLARQVTDLLEMRTRLEARRERILDVAEQALQEDVSARKEAQHALHASEVRYRSLAESSPLGIWHIDTEGYSVYANPAMCEMLEIDDATELEGRTYHEFFTAEGLEIMAREHERRASGVASNYEVDLVGRHGRRRKVLISGAPLFGRDGSLEGLIGTFLDVTERRELESQLWQLQKMESIGQLAAGVAHDFNNILTVIHGEVSLLKLECDDPEIAESLGRITDATRRASDLTRQLLLFSRKKEMTPEALDLDEQIDSLTRMLDRLVGESVTLETRLHGDLSPVRANPGTLDQAITNLVVNARDAMPEGGKVEIETAEVEVSVERAARNPEAHAGRFVRLSVRDAGSGIPTGVLPHIFEPFFTTKEAGRGTGLGLATVYGIVRQHGGWLEVESRADEGSAFHVYLPRAGDPES